MDNLPIMKHANREAKCTHLKAAEEVASAMSTVCPMVSHITFEYIPRESNSFADLAAGLASSSLLPSRNASEPELIFHENRASLSLPIIAQTRRMTISADDSQLTLTERTDIETPLLRAYRNSLEEQRRTPAWKAYVRFLLGENPTEGTHGHLPH